MPTGACKFPEHHGPSAGQPISLVILIGLGALIVAHWRTVLVCLVVSGILIALGAAVVLLIHRHRESVAEHEAWEIASRAAARDRQLAASRQPAIHNHVHLHGLTAEDVAAVIARQPQPIAIEESK